VRGGGSGREILMRVGEERRGGSKGEGGERSGHVSGVAGRGVHITNY